MNASKVFELLQDYVNLLYFADSGIVMANSISRSNCYPSLSFHFSLFSSMSTKLWDGIICMSFVGRLSQPQL